jgi:hypothetical protein
MRLAPLISVRLDRLERRLGRPRANVALPERVRLEEVESWLRLGEQLDALRGSIWTPGEPGKSDKLTLLLRYANDAAPGVSEASTPDAPAGMEEDEP